jgi:uncharacterized membrane protein
MLLAFALPISMLTHLLTTSPISQFSHYGEVLLQDLALLLKITLEFIAILIIALVLIMTLRRLLRIFRPSRFQTTAQTLRLELGHTLALSLEFLLAADIVGTAVSPSWSAIAKLAAITGIRTFLNYFLQREVQALQAQSQSAPPVLP